VDVDAELDTEPREVVVPADLTAALEGDDSAREAFERQSYSHRRRRVTKTLETLHEGLR
jgi:uncharacterized protein YdeI (YjbR/CyaY-like superfamily)